MVLGASRVGARRLSEAQGEPDGVDSSVDGAVLVAAHVGTTGHMPHDHECAGRG